MEGLLRVPGRLGESRTRILPGINWESEKQSKGVIKWETLFPKEEKRHEVM